MAVIIECLAIDDFGPERCLERIGGQGRAQGCQVREPTPSRAVTQPRRDSLACI